MIRVVLPFHLRTLARVEREVQLEVHGPVTQRSILDALETKFPMLRGTVRDQETGQRRTLLRFFACEEDISHDSPDAVLPEKVASGAEAFYIIGAIAGGSPACESRKDRGSRGVRRRRARRGNNSRR